MHVNIGVLDEMASHLTWSLLKAQICLEALATVVTVEKKISTTNNAPSTHVALTEPVAF